MLVKSYQLVGIDFGHFGQVVHYILKQSGITLFHHTKNVRMKKLNKNSWISTRCKAPKQSYATLASITQYAK